MGFRLPTRASRYTRRAFHALAVALVSILFLGAGDTAARYQQLGNSLMCTCGCRQILLQCNHVGCSASDRMTKELQAALTRGDSDDLVRQAFVQKYGETVLAAPEAKGFNLIAWIMPGVTFLVGTLLVVWVVQRWRLHGAVAGAEIASPALNPYRERARRETEL
ncbi:MAG TPA: cytochrome c-type biogenesis protein CcmH [Terriglobales bacterium]|nr:cytochrome c-type biogenesis protein CcmH [Terriglobales bacterium]